MNEDKGFSLLLKIVIIAVLLVLVVVTILIYSKNLNKEELGEQKIVNVEEKVEDKKITFSYDELVENYQNSLQEVLNNFDGNYNNLQKQITEILVPSGFQELHLKLVLALNPLLYEDNFQLSKEKLEAIAEENDWLVESLNKLVLSIK